jgi:hypothetical protein
MARGQPLNVVPPDLAGAFLIGLGGLLFLHGLGRFFLGLFFLYLFFPHDLPPQVNAGAAFAISLPVFLTAPLMNFG